MKKLFILILAILLITGFFTISFAGISGTAHDFSDRAWNPVQEVCNVCHIPHNATYATQGPLWNHMVTTATFTPYSSPTGTMQATVGQPNGASKLCLSCHDGTVAIDSFGGNLGSNFIGGDALIDPDLSDDHPISFTYDADLASNDGELETPSNGTVGSSNLPLYDNNNDQLECATCHDAHDNSIPKFLRVTMVDSALCTQCHQK